MKSLLSILVALGLFAVAAPAQMVSSHAPTSAAKVAPQSNATQISPLMQPTGKPVVRVNGTVLNDRDLVHELYVIFPYAQLHNGIPKNMEPEMRRGALEMIIFDELVYQEALRRKMTVPEPQLKAAEKKFMTQVPDKASFDAFLAVECKGSMQVFREKLRRTLLIDALIKQEVGSSAKVSDAELRNFYNQNPKKFDQPESFSIQSISILPPPTASPETLKEARKRADAALKAAKATKSYQEFGLVAEKYSDDDYHVNMGDHKAVLRADLPPEVVKAASAMKQGEVSDLIQLGPNYTIFRLNAHTHAGKVSFDEVKDKLRTELEKMKFDQMRSEFNKRLRKTATVKEL